MPSGRLVGCLTFAPEWGVRCSIFRSSAILRFIRSKIRRQWLPVMCRYAVIRLINNLSTLRYPAQVAVACETKATLRLAGEGDTILLLVSLSTDGNVSRGTP